MEDLGWIHFCLGYGPVVGFGVFGTETADSIKGGQLGNHTFRRLVQKQSKNVDVAQKIMYWSGDLLSYEVAPCVNPVIVTPARILSAGVDG
jgi:hypothetical protein